MLEYRPKCVKNYTAVTHKRYRLTTGRQSFFARPTSRQDAFRGPAEFRNDSAPAGGIVSSGHDAEVSEATPESRKLAQFIELALVSYMYTQLDSRPDFAFQGV
jgi:hypothetical protein